jgi:hypothetical protein
MGDLKDILTIIFERANAAATLWNYLLTVILTGVAFLVAASEHLRSKLILAGLTIGYLTFAYENCMALNDVQGERRILSEYAASKLKKEPELQGLRKKIEAPSYARTISTHLAGDISAVAAIWLIPYLSRRAAQRELEQTGTKPARTVR